MLAVQYSNTWITTVSIVFSTSFSQVLSKFILLVFVLQQAFNAPMSEEETIFDDPGMSFILLRMLSRFLIIQQLIGKYAHYVRKVSVYVQSTKGRRNR